MVGGLAGTGKTKTAKVLSKRLQAALLDKDTLTRPLVEKLLQTLGSHEHDRESEIYLREVRPLEYAILLKTAREVLDGGSSVVLAAPFISELSNPEWLSNFEFDAQMGSITTAYIWVQADDETTRQRLIARAAPRDAWKLAHWEEYLEATSDIRMPTLPDGRSWLITNGREDALLAQIEERSRDIQSL